SFSFRDGTNWPSFSMFFCSPSSVLFLCICFIITASHIFVALGSSFFFTTSYSGKLGASGSATMCFFSLVQPLSLAFRPLVSDFKGLVCMLSIFDLVSCCTLSDGLIIAFECLCCVAELLNLDSTVTLAAALKSVFVLLESCKSDAKCFFWFGSFLLALRVINPSLLLSCLEDLSIARWVTGASVLGAGENICASEGTLDDLFVLFEGLGIDFTFMSCFCFCIC
uniref:Uncharacterized protein n=1 Tax=Cyprinus carpio TaxID=7962 RepID=A0A8C1GRV8_CYPCA